MVGKCYSREGIFTKKSFSMSVQGFEHHLQREIFLKIRQHDIAKYSDLVIKNVEPSQFMYHLKQLIRDGLIEKVDKGQYRLTRQGIMVSQGFSSEQKNIVLAPITYSLIFARSVDDTWLIMKRRKQPYINQYGCLSGKLHMAETLKLAAKREWREHISDKVPELNYKGYVSVLLTKEHDVVTHITGPVWFADNVEPDWQAKQAKTGEFEWVNWQQLDYAEFIPGWKEIINHLNEPAPFLLDLSFELTK
jgi:ADP-ribose pyrophosphatase YjhB (NUDIX family)